MAATEVGFAAEHELKVLFLGSGGDHRPGDGDKRLRDLGPPMLDRGIRLYYTDDVRDLEESKLARYDVVLLYAEHPELPEESGRALFAYVHGGGGFVGIHTAASNFRNSEEFVAMLGGRYEGDGGVQAIATTIVAADHELMRGFEGFESGGLDFRHTDHNPENRTVLEQRGEEPWTWVREHGDGRVFYTAWGHDRQTWINEGFVDLIERGIRWAAGQDVQAVLATREVVSPLVYDEATIPVPHQHIVRIEEGLDKWTQLQRPLSPGDSMSRMVLPAGFRVELFASEPDVINPLAIAWDERGRVWVAESVDYPNDLHPEVGEGNDRIRILEDTNGDGRADTFTTFAEGLNIATSMVFYNGGVIVHQAPQTLFLKDTNGDGKADHWEVLFEGWRQWDTHAGPSHLRWGFDNHLWGTQGYAGFEGEVDGVEHKFAMGIHRFPPDGSSLELMRSTNNNTWGLAFGEDGNLFTSTANGNALTHYQFPNRLVQTVPGMRADVTERLVAGHRVIAFTNLFRQVDFIEGYTAASGCNLYTARTWPREFWNRIAFVSEPSAHVTGNFVMERNGSTFRAANHHNLVVSDDEWFAPIYVEVGPDGHVWVADWYNYHVQHNRVGGQRGGPGNAGQVELRDKEHGRIYRIVWEEAEPSPRMDLANATPTELLRALTHDNMFWRMHAQRLLVERGEHDVGRHLLTLIEDQSVDEMGLNAPAVHALWVLHGLGLMVEGIEPAIDAAKKAMSHPSYAVRRNAVQVLPANEDTRDAILSAGLLEDEDAQVRLAALVALADVPASRQVGEAIREMLEKNENRGDTLLRQAGEIAGAKHQ